MLMEPFCLHEYIKHDLPSSARFVPKDNGPSDFSKQFARPHGEISLVYSYVIFVGL